jgi:hypothetical protein
MGWSRETGMGNREWIEPVLSNPVILANAGIHFRGE